VGLVGVVFIVILVAQFDAEMNFPTLLSAAGNQAVGTVANIGRLLYTKYVFTFEAASILIMTAIVGAVMLAKRNPVGPGASTGSASGLSSKEGEASKKGGAA